MTYPLSDIQQAAADIADQEWRRGVYDQDSGQEPSIRRITEYHYEVGGWWSTFLKRSGETLPDGRPAYREVYYDEEGDRRFMSWCGIFAAYCYLRVGHALADGMCVPVTLHPKVAQKALPSTFKLTQTANWNGTPPAEPDFADIRPGDLVITGQDKWYGDHITLAAAAPEAGAVRTLSGNGTGRFDDGSRGEGVVEIEYDKGDVAAIYRPTDGHILRYDEVTA